MSLNINIDESNVSYNRRPFIPIIIKCVELNG